MTIVQSLSGATIKPMVSTPSARGIGMETFEQHLDAGRAHGFNELGMFGLGKATQADTQSRDTARATAPNVASYEGGQEPGQVMPAVDRADCSLEQPPVMDEDATVVTEPARTAVSTVPDAAPPIAAGCDGLSKITGPQFPNAPPNKLGVLDAPARLAYRSPSAASSFSPLGVSIAGEADDLSVSVHAPELTPDDHAVMRAFTEKTSEDFGLRVTRFQVRPLRQKPGFSSMTGGNDGSFTG